MYTYVKIILNIAFFDFNINRDLLLGYASPIYNV